MVFVYFSSKQDREKGIDAIFKGGGPFSLYEGREPGSFVYEASSSVLEALASEGIPHIEVPVAELEKYLSPRGWEYYQNMQRFGGTAGLVAGIFGGGRGKRLTDEEAERIRVILGADKPRKNR